MYDSESSEPELQLQRVSENALHESRGVTQGKGTCFLPGPRRPAPYFSEEGFSSHPDKCCTLRRTDTTKEDMGVSSPGLHTAAPLSDHSGERTLELRSSDIQVHLSPSRDAP